MDSIASQASLAAESCQAAVFEISDSFIMEVSRKKTVPKLANFLTQSY